MTREEPQESRRRKIEMLNPAAHRILDNEDLVLTIQSYLDLGAVSQLATWAVAVEKFPAATWLFEERSHGLVLILSNRGRYDVLRTIAGQGHLSNCKKPFLQDVADVASRGGSLELKTHVIHITWQGICREVHFFESVRTDINHGLSSFKEEGEAVAMGVMAEGAFAGKEDVVHWASENRLLCRSHQKKKKSKRRSLGYYHASIWVALFQGARAGQSSVLFSILDRYAESVFGATSSVLPYLWTLLGILCRHGHSETIFKVMGLISSDARQEERSSNESFIANLSLVVSIGAIHGHVEVLSKIFLCMAEAPPKHLRRALEGVWHIVLQEQHLPAAVDRPPRESYDAIQEVATVPFHKEEQEPVLSSLEEDDLMTLHLLDILTTLWTAESKESLHRRVLVEVLAQHGPNELLERILTSRPTVFRRYHRRALQVSIRHGRLHTVKWLMKTAEVKDVEGDTNSYLTAVRSAAAKAAHPEVIQYLAEHFPRMVQTSGALAAAIRSGHLSTVRVLIELDKGSSGGTNIQQRDDCSQALREAINHNWVDVVAYVVQHRPDLARGGGLVEEAVKCGRICLLELLLEVSDPLALLPSPTPQMAHALSQAVNKGHARVIDCVGPYWPDFFTPKMLENAIRRQQIGLIRTLGKVLCVKTLKEKSVPRPDSLLAAVAEAASNGRLAILQAVGDHLPHLLTYETLEMALTYGHNFEVPLYLYNLLPPVQGQPSITLKEQLLKAARRRETEFIKFTATHRPDLLPREVVQHYIQCNDGEMILHLHNARKDLCPKELAAWAGRHQHLGVLEELLKSQRAEAFDGNHSLIVHATEIPESNHLYNWLIEKAPECVTTANTVRAASRGDLETLKRIHKSGLSEAFSATTAEAALCRRKWEVLDWLHLNYPGHFTAEVMEAAAALDSTGWQWMASRG